MGFGLNNQIVQVEVKGLMVATGSAHYIIIFYKTVLSVVTLMKLLYACHKFAFILPVSMFCSSVVFK